MSSVGRALPDVPVRPLLAPWARVAAEGGRISVRIDDAAIVLEGPAADRLLPALLPLLDGERTADELSACFGAAIAPAVRNALGVLALQGLLVEGPSVATAPPGAAFLAGFGAAAGLGAGRPAAVVDALAARRVAVVGEGAVAALVAALVAAAGPRVERLPLAGVAGDDDEACGFDLVVAVPGGAGRGLLGEVDDALRARGRPWLAVPGLDGSRALVGPIVVPGASCCYACFTRRRADASGFGDAWAALDRAPGPELAGAPAALVAAVAAQIALCAMADGIGVAVPAGVVWAVDLVPEIAVTRHVVHRVPRCPACSPAVALPGLLPWRGEAAA